MPELPEQPEEQWDVIYTTNSEISAELTRAYLCDSGIDARIFSQRDHTIRANLPNAQLVRVLVPLAFSGEAAALLEQLHSADAPPDDTSTGESSL